MRHLPREVVQAVVADHVVVGLAAEGVKGRGHCLQRRRRALLRVEPVDDVPCAKTGSADVLLEFAGMHEQSVKMLIFTDKLQAGLQCSVVQIHICGCPACG